MNEKPNIGYLFYKEYYMKDNSPNEIEKNFDIKNKIILSQTIDKYKDYIYNNKLVNHCFSLKTIYPGLLIGSGYMHGIGEKEDFKIGFYFDYTSGLPCIPGSSVKGLLRSAFQHQDYIKQLMDELNITNKSKEVDIKKLENEIFDGKDGEDNNLPMSKRDIFFDAVIDVKKSDGRNIFADDYITPHYQDELKDPVPIKFLKVSSGIAFRFQFNLKDGIIEAKDKIKLFERIILDLGIGAKTNVGYGRFETENK